MKRNLPGQIRFEFNDEQQQLYDEFQYYTNPNCYAYNENDPYFYNRYEYPDPNLQQYQAWW